MIEYFMVTIHGGNDGIVNKTTKILLEIEWIKEDPTYYFATRWLATKILLQGVFHSIDQKNGPSEFVGLKDFDKPLVYIQKVKRAKSMC